MNHKSAGIFVFVMSVFFNGLCWGAEITADEILRRVDKVRCPDESFSLVARVSSYKLDGPKQSALYDVRMQSREKAIVRTLQPAHERGRLILMRDNDFWFFFPEVSKPLKITAEERFLGDIANGDIARINFFSDYRAQFLKEEIIGQKKYDVLQLSAKDKKATYGKAVLWVEKKTYWPLKAEFYAESGRFLKTCSYENYKMLAGRMRPSRLVLRDALVEGQYSVIEYDKIELEKIEDKYFTREYLKKMVF